MNRPLSGLIDEFRLYNYALSPEEIKQLFEKCKFGSGGSIPCTLLLTNHVILFKLMFQAVNNEVTVPYLLLLNPLCIYLQTHISSLTNFPLQILHKIFFILRQLYLHFPSCFILTWIFFLAGENKSVFIAFVFQLKIII